MRKHFLLLFLMALLPLAGWAYDYEVDVEVKPYNASVVWSGVKPDGVDASWIGAPGSTLTTAVKNAIAEQLEINNLADYNAGTHDYYLQLKSTADGFVDNGDTRYNIRLNDANTAQLTITKFTEPAVIIDGALAFVDDDLVYTSQPQALLKAGATATANGFTVPVVYATSATAENWVSWENLEETNANTDGYTVYYKVVGTDNYAGSVVKTMAETKVIAKADNTISDLALAGWTYDPAKTAEPLATGENPAITFTATNGADAATFAYKKGTGEYGTWAEKVGGHAGSYTLKATIAESDNYKAGEAEVAFTIAKATAVLNVEGVINTDWTVYDGSTHQLFKQAATATVGESQTPVTVKYTYKYCPPGGNFDASWATARTTITNSYLKKTDAGRYRLNISVEGNDDYNGTSNKVGDAFPVLTVAQADIPTESYTAPAGNTLMDTDADQPLITAGAWNDANVTYGTFKYSLDNSTWGEDVSVGNAAGGYTVYAKIDPTNAVNYKATVFDPIEVTIAAKTTVTIATNANQSFGYGTTPVIAKTVTWTDQRQDALNEEGMVWKWYTNSDCSTPATVDGNGNYAVGDYYVKAYGATVTGTTAASQEIVYTPALVKITAGQVTASISATAVYGGLPTYTLTHVSGLSPAEAENFNAANNLGVVTVKKGEEIILNGVANNSNDLKTLPQGTYTLEATASCGANYAVVVSAGTLTVSAKSIADAVITVTTAADDIVYNNKAWGTVNPIEFTVDETSGIEAADYDVAYSNNINAGTATITLTGKRNYTGTVTKDFTIKKAALTIKADDTTWTYGTTEPTYAVTVTGQAEGETALAVDGTLAGIDGTLTVVRTSNATVGLHADALVAKFGAAQPAATNYDITYEAGDLTIGKAAATIQLKADVAATLKSEYGVSNAAAKTLIEAKLQNINNYEVKSGISAAELASVNVGSVTCDLADEEYQVTQNYSFTATGATSTNYDVAIDLEGVYFTVTPAPITLYAANQAIDWSDTDPDNDAADTEVKSATVSIAAGELKYNDALTDVVASINIAGTNVGNNNITLTAATNANYNITVNKDAGDNDKIGNLSITGAGTITLSRTEGVEQLIKDYDTQTPAHVILDRNISRTEAWFAMVLPFEVSVAELSQKFGYAIVNVLDESNTDPSKVKFKINMQTIAANQPFLVKIATAIDAPVDFGSKTIVYNAEPKSQDAAGNTFYGIFKTTALAASEDLWIMVPAQNKFNKLDQSGTTLTPINAYLKTAQNLDSFAPSIFVEEIDGTVTAINGVDAEVEQNAEGWYTINGVKLNAKPTQKGIYIYNGKKVAIQ